MVENYRKDVQESIISKYRVNNTTPTDLYTNETEDQTKLKQISKLTGFSWENIVSMQKKYSFFQSLKNSNNISILSSDLSIPTFREFALYVSDQILKCSLLVNSACLESVDVHWQPFFNRCAPCDIKYKAIVKVSISQSVLSLLGTRSHECEKRTERGGEKEKERERDKRERERLSTYITYAS